MKAAAPASQADAHNRWNAPNPPSPDVRAAWPLAVVALAPLAIFGLLVASVGPGVALTGALVVIALAVAWVAAQGRRALASVRAMPVESGTEPRLTNLVVGLASDLAIDPPKVHLIPAAEINAFIVPAWPRALAVTEGAVRSCTLTELEALVAHSLLRLRGRRRWRLLFAIAFAPALACIGYDDDVRTAALTRYPPALATALAKASLPSGRYAPCWFSAAGSAHRSPEERIAQLADL